MTDRHLDEGIIQAYIDGELPGEEAAAAAAHLGSCDVCSAALAEAEGESSFLAAAFATDESLSVPTAALRARLNAAVAQLEAPAESAQRHSRGRRLGGFLASLAGAFSFTPRAAAAFATLLVAVAAGIIYVSSQGPRPTAPAREVAQTPNPAPAPLPAATATPGPEAATPVVVPEQNVKAAGYVAAGYGKRSDKRRAGAAPAPKGPAPKEEALPGEKEYRTAIATLEKTIKFGGEQSLRPTLRADYERNLAVIDSAITQTRQVAARNPKDKDAVSFLMSAYQSKVELLTRVADQAQVAALGR